MGVFGLIINGLLVNFDVILLELSLTNRMPIVNMNSKDSFFMKKSASFEMMLIKQLNRVCLIWKKSKKK